MTGPQSGVLAFTTDSTAATYLVINSEDYLGTRNGQFYAVVNQVNGTEVCQKFEIWSESMIQETSDPVVYIQCKLDEGNGLDCVEPNGGQMELYWDGGDIYQDFEDGEFCTAVGMTTYVSLMAQMAS